MKKLALIFLSFIFNYTYAQNQSSSNIIGNVIEIDRLAVAQNDFSTQMNWSEARSACLKLGKGWRLPKNYELDILFKNKDKFGGFKSSKYWSSTEITHLWSYYQDFQTGGFANGSPKKTNLYYVRAVKDLESGQEAK